MKSLIFLGAIGLFLSGLCYYAEHKRWEGQEEGATYALEKVLKAESRTLGSRIEEAVLKADRDALLVAARWRKKPAMQTFASDTALAEPGSPKWVIVTGRRLRAAGLLDDPLLEDALEAHLGKKERFALHASRGKTYLFVRGNLPTGQPYTAAYLPENFFSGFHSGDGLRVWIAGKDGTVIFHPLQRFVGSNVSNLRPVAAGLQRLSQGKQEQFTQRYLGLEGREALGAWTILPEQGLLVANEWPRELGISGRSSWIGKIGIVLSWLSFLSWGIALAESKGSSASDPVKPIFPTSRLDDDALEYLEQAKAKTDEAMEFARAQEALADRVTRERAEILGRARELEARYKLLESFQSRVLPKLTGKQVLAELGRLVSENFPGMSVGVYRYSPSSFSLVPEALFDGAGLGESAKSFLQDTRIFLGNPQLIPNVLSTEAFAKWNRNRQRHMPNHDTGFRVFPFTAQGNRGALLVLFEEGINNQRELEPSFQFMDQLIQKAATFCDSLGPLLQSSYAKANAGAPLASAPNGVGNRPRPT